MAVALTVAPFYDARDVAAVIGVCRSVEVVGNAIGGVTG